VAVVEVGGVVVVVVVVVVAHPEPQGAVHTTPLNEPGGVARQSQPEMVVQALLSDEFRT
jgi:hypothetical protein